MAATIRSSARRSLYELRVGVSEPPPMPLKPIWSLMKPEPFSVVVKYVFCCAL